MAERRPVKPAECFSSETGFISKKSDCSILTKVGEINSWFCVFYVYFFLFLPVNPLLALQIHREGIISLQAVNDWNDPTMQHWERALVADKYNKFNINSLLSCTDSQTPRRNIKGLIFLQELKRHIISPVVTACLQNTCTDFCDVLTSGACWELGRSAPMKAQMKNRWVFISNALFHHPSITDDDERPLVTPPVNDWRCRI